MTPTTLPIPVLRLVEFVYGVMLANLLRFIPLAKIKLGGTLGECVVAGLIVAIMAMTDDMQIKAVSAVLMGVLILQLGAGRGIVSRLLSSKPLILLGGASYALYLIEGPVQALCTRYLSAPFNLIHPALSLAGAVAIFLWWEQPCRKAILAAFRSGHNRTPP